MVYGIMNKEFYDEVWYQYLTGEWRIPAPLKMRVWLGIERTIYHLLPSSPHCIECRIPMAGVGGSALRFLGSEPSTFSSRFCRGCEKDARKYESGAEVELTMLFANVRDSTPLAESQGVKGFKEIINRFYKETSNVLIEDNALVNRLRGDQVIALLFNALLARVMQKRPWKRQRIFCGNRSRVHASADHYYTGKISKEGRSELRAALIASAWVAVRWSEYWRKTFQPSAHRIRKQKAITVIARRMLIVVWHVLTKRELDRRADPEAIARSLMTWSSAHHLTKQSCLEFVAQGLETLGILDQVISFRANGRIHHLRPNP